MLRQCLESHISKTMMTTSKYFAYRTANDAARSHWHDLAQIGHVPGGTGRDGFLGQLSPFALALISSHIMPAQDSHLDAERDRDRDKDRDYDPDRADRALQKQKPSSAQKSALLLLSFISRLTLYS